MYGVIYAWYINFDIKAPTYYEGSSTGRHAANMPGGMPELPNKRPAVLLLYDDKPRAA